MVEQNRYPLVFCLLLSKVDLLVPFPPDLSRGEHATGTTLVTERSLTGAVSSSSGDTRNTGHSATWNTTYQLSHTVLSLLESCLIVYTYQYPRTRQKSVHQPSRSRHMAVSCFWQHRSEPSCNSHQSLPFLLTHKSRSKSGTYLTISGRIGEVKTVGRG